MLKLNIFYNSLDAIKNNLKYNINLNFSYFGRQIKLYYHFITLNNNI